MFRGLVRNWWQVLPMLWLAMPTRLSPHGGMRGLSRRVVTLRFRNGLVARARLDELFSFVDVFLLDAYDAGNAPWDSAHLVVDVGANVGAATLWLSRRCPEARILAFEPDDDVASRLDWNVESNGLHQRVRVIRAAVGSTAGTAELVRSGASVFNRIDVVDGPPLGSIPVVALADVLADEKAHAVDILKLDCEGAELDVLKGLGDLSAVRFITGEWHTFGRYDRADLEQLLASSGLDVHFTGDGTFGMFSASRAS